MRKLLTLLLVMAATAAMAQNDINIGVYDLDKTSADDPSAKGSRTVVVDTVAPVQAGVNVQAQLDGDTLEFVATAPLVKLAISTVSDSETTLLRALPIAEQKEGKVCIGTLPEKAVIRFQFIAKDGSEAEILMDN